MADGDIKLTVSLTATDIKQTASQLRGEIDKIFKANAGQQLTASMKSVMVQMDKMVSKSIQLENKLQEIDRISLGNITKEWKDVQQKLYSAHDALDKIDASKDPKGFERAQQEVERLTKDLQLLEREYDRVAKFGSVGLPEYDSTAGRLGEVNNQMVLLKARAEQASSATQSLGRNSTQIDTLGSALGKAATVADRFNRALLGAVKSGLGAIRSLISNLKNNLVRTLNKVKSAVEKAFSSRTLKRNLTTLLKYTIGVRSLYFAFRRLRSAVQEGLNNLVQFESETNLTNQRMTEFKTSLLYLKNAWGAAFAPIINVVMPILTAFIDALASVANAIARFIAALTGQSTVIQALKVSVGDYAQSLGGAGSSAKKAADEQKKLNDRLAAFDDLNVLGKDKDDEDTSPSGGGGGGGNLPSVNDMFERINTPFNELAQKLHDAWERGDFFGIGEILGEQLKESLTKLNTWLLTEGRAKILGIGQAIGDMIDGFISVDKLAHVIGSTLGTAIALGIDFVNTIITPERLYKIGEFIIEGVNAFIPKVVPKLGELFGNLFHSAISFAYGMIHDADFKGWGKSIAKAIRNFFTEMFKVNKETGYTGWQELGLAFTEGVTGFADMIIEALNGINPAQIRLAIEQLLDKIDWEAIKSKLKELWDTLWKTLGEIFPDIDFDSIKKDIEAIVTSITEILGNIPWGDIKDTIIAILNALASVEPDQWSSIAKGVMSVVIALEALSAVTTVGKFFEMLGAGGGSAGGLLPAIGALGDLALSFQLLKTSIEDLIDTVNGSWGGDWGSAITDVLTNPFSIKSGLIDAFTEQISERAAIWSQGDGIFDDFFGKVGQTWDLGWAEIFNDTDKIEEILGGLDIPESSNVSEWTRDLRDSIVNNLGEAWEWLEDHPSPIVTLLDSLPSGEEIDQAITNMWNGMEGWRSPADALMTALDEWDGSQLDEWIGNIGKWAQDGFNANFGDGSATKATALEAFEGLFDGLSSEQLDTFIQTVTDNWTVFKDNIQLTAEAFKTNLSNTFTNLKDSFSSIVDTVSSKLDGWKENFSAGITFIRDTASEFKESFIAGFISFKDSLIEGLDIIKDALDFSETLEGMGEVFRGAFNSVVDVINSFLNILAQGINGIGDLIGDLEFDNPITGTHYSLGIPTVSAIQIPHLAQGAVIPPNKEFMAVLGDQTSGTNIEAPLDTIRQAVGDELAPYLQQLIEINAQVITAINNKNLTIGDRQIGQANARYTARQNMVRGTSM